MLILCKIYNRRQNACDCAQIRSALPAPDSHGFSGGGALRYTVGVHPTARLKALVK